MTKHLFDILNVIFYVIITGIAGVFTVSEIAEGYIELVIIGYSAILTGILMLLTLVLLKLLTKYYYIVNSVFGVLLFIFFESSVFLFWKISLFGIHTSEPLGFSNEKFAVSMASLISIVLLIISRLILLKMGIVKNK